jgi:hypothetical protein
MEHQLDVTITVLLIFKISSTCCVAVLHIVQISNAQKPCLPHQQDIIPYVVKISVLRSWRWANVCPKYDKLILEINKTVIVASSWCSIFTLLTLIMHGQTQIKLYKWLRGSRQTIRTANGVDPCLTMSSNTGCSKCLEPKFYLDRQPYSRNKPRQLSSQVVTAASFVFLAL